MAVTLEQIGTWLTNSGVNHQHVEEKDLIIFVMGNEKTSQAHFIRARENGELFDWAMQLLDENRDNVNLGDNQYSAKVLSHMLYMNYQTKFGTWEFDPADGDIRLEVEIPLEDALMTEKQFNRILGFMRKNGQSGADEIRQLMTTGELSKAADDDSSEAATIAKLEAMLAQLRGGVATAADTSSDSI
ncbi:MAG: YbjN domain-containing protein [Sulfurimonadaceae bacterium]